jgi:hypothetical protein
MTTKKIKEEIKKPDIVIRTVEAALEFIQAHLRLVIIAAVIFCAAGVSVYGYVFYQDKQNERTQITVSEGVKNLESYYATGKKEDLDKAESTFQKVVKEKKGKIYMVAKLYLATVYAIKGRADDARNMYQELSRKSPPALRMLAEKGLQNLGPKK